MKRLTSQQIIERIKTLVRTKITVSLNKKPLNGKGFISQFEVLIQFNKTNTKRGSGRGFVYNKITPQKIKITPILIQKAKRELTKTIEKITDRRNKWCIDNGYSIIKVKKTRKRIIKLCKKDKGLKEIKETKYHLWYGHPIYKISVLDTINPEFKRI